MNKYQQLRQLADEALITGEKWILESSTVATAQGRIAHLFTLSIFEQFRAALILFDNNLGTHAPCLLRGMLEYLGELVNVTTNPAYIEQLSKENAFSDKRVIDSYSMAIGDAIDSDPIYKEVGELLAEINGRDRMRDELRSTKIKKTELAELPFLYSMLCSMTHPNLTSLAVRHINSKGKFAYLRPPEPDIRSMLLSVGLRLLSYTISQIPEFLNCDKIQVEAFVNRINSQNLDPCTFKNL